MENISKHITYREATNSPTAKRLGLSNIPNDEQLESMKYLAAHIFEPLRENFDTKIGISSFFRSDVLNEAIKGSTKSQHRNGEAMDIDADIYGIITNKDIFNYIKDNLEFDQLIGEAVNGDDFGWVHVSLKQSNNRHEILTMEVVNGKQVFKRYGNV